MEALREPSLSAVQERSSRREAALRCSYPQGGRPKNAQHGSAHAIDNPLVLALYSGSSFPAELRCVQPGALDYCGLEVSRCRRWYPIPIDDPAEAGPGLPRPTESSPPVLHLGEGEVQPYPQPSRCLAGELDSLVTYPVPALTLPMASPAREKDGPGLGSLEADGVPTSPALAGGRALLVTSSTNEMPLLHSTAHGCLRCI